MIISHQHRYIFFAVPKTGTHSVREALREQLGPDDEEQVGLFVQKRFSYPEFANIRHGHLSVRQIRPVIGEDKFNGYLKFAYVRNPFDRFVSFCSFMARATDHFKKTPTAFMKYVIHQAKPFNELLFLPQHSFLVDEAGALRMDVVCRNETMQASYDEVCARVGIASRPLGKLNATERRPYQEYYDRELIDWVGNFYRKDLEMFGYSFE